MGIRVTRQNLVPLFALGPYFAFGLVSFMGGAVLLFLASAPYEAGLYRHPLVLGTVHATVLGWGVSIALGSLQQMVPVVFGTQLHSMGLAAAGAYGFVVGVISLVWGMATFQRGALYIGSFLIPAAVGITLFNVARSVGQGEAPTAQRIRPFVLSALFYLALTVVIGATLAVNLVTDWLGPAWQSAFAGHTTAGLVGWFTMLVMGISYHLLPFFGLTPKKVEPKSDRFVLNLLHFVVWSWGLGGVLQIPWLAQGARLVLAATVGLFLWDTRALFAPRPMNKMNPTVTYVRLAHLYAAVVAIGVLASLWLGESGRYISWLGVAGLFGWLSSAILGYLHRILPFFVWHNKYWHRTGEPGVPSFRHMVHEGVAWLGLALYHAGLLGLLVLIPFGFSVRGYAALLGLGTLVATGNLMRTLLR